MEILLDHTVIDHLFDAMKGLYGNRWTSAQGEYDSEGTWYRELKCLKPAAIERGLMKCRSRVRDAARSNDIDWPPQAAEFVILCEPNPADYGLPTEDKAWDEVCRYGSNPDSHKWSHLAVRLAIRVVGTWEIENTNSPTRRLALEKRFKKQYSALVNRVMSGMPLEEQRLIESDANMDKKTRQESWSRYTADPDVNKYDKVRSHSAFLNNFRSGAK